MGTQQQCAGRRIRASIPSARRRSLHEPAVVAQACSLVPACGALGDAPVLALLRLHLREALQQILLGGAELLVAREHLLLCQPRPRW